MPDIGGKRFASSMLDDLKVTVAKEMGKARSLIGSAVDELAQEIRNGSEMVASAVRAEALGVREEFGSILGNAGAAAADAVAEAKKAVATAEAAKQPEAPKQAPAATAEAPAVPVAAPEAGQPPANPTPALNGGAA